MHQQRDSQRGMSQKPGLYQQSALRKFEETGKMEDKRTKGGKTLFVFPGGKHLCFGAAF